jgi:ribosomal protein S18 acetylase RimI-like enzyme
VFVLADSGRPVASGSFVTKQDGQLLRIGRVVVDSARRGEGWGRRLLQALLDRADADPQVTATELGVFTHNLVARGLYERLGFVAAGETSTIEVDSEPWHMLDLRRPAPGR